MAERRGEIRRNPDYQLEVYDRATGKHLGILLNVTADGLQVKSKALYPTGSEFRCRIPLPGNIMLTEELLFDARAVWSRQMENTQEFHTGFEMIRMTPEERELIDLVLKEISVSGHWV